MPIPVLLEETQLCCLAGREHALRAGKSFSLYQTGLTLRTDHLLLIGSSIPSIDFSFRLPMRCSCQILPGRKAVTWVGPEGCYAHHAHGVLTRLQSRTTGNAAWQQPRWLWAHLIMEGVALNDLRHLGTIAWEAVFGWPPQPALQPLPLCHLAVRTSCHHPVRQLC